MSLHPLDVQYELLKCGLTLLDKKSKTHKVNANFNFCQLHYSLFSPDKNETCLVMQLSLASGSRQSLSGWEIFHTI